MSEVPLFTVCQHTESSIQTEGRVHVASMRECGTPCLDKAQHNLFDDKAHTAGDAVSTESRVQVYLAHKKPPSLLGPP